MTMQALTHEYGPGCWCGRDCSTTPTPLREALATALRDGGYVRSVAGRYGHFNDAYWDQSADAILAHPSMQAVAEHEAVGRAVARLLEATKDEAGLALLHVPAGTRPDGRVIATEEGWTVERWASVWGHVTSNGATLPEAIVAALGPSDAGVDAPVTSWADHDFKPMRTGTIGSPCQWCGKPGPQHRATRGPSEGERTEAGT